MPGVRQKQKTDSGEPVAIRETKRQSAENDKLPTEEDIPGPVGSTTKASGKEDNATSFRTPGFRRMRTEWNSDDRMVITRAQSTVDARIDRIFLDAYEIMNGIYEIVRTPEHDEHGEPRRNQFGHIIWARKPNGTYDEDFTRLTSAQKEHFLFLITTRLFDWKQRAADLWGEAMLAKGQWEERYSMGFDAPMSGTVEDRTAKGRLESLEERYFAIFASILSRKADGIVSSLELLAQRLKDSLYG